MAVVTQYINLSTGGDSEIIDITAEVEEKVRDSGIGNGIVTISVIGSTGAITTCEYEPGLLQDIKEFIARLIPEGQYHHDQTWGDGNGHSHLRSTLLGPSLSVPFVQQELILGTWQQIIFIDFDNRPRSRKLICQIIGE